MHICVLKQKRITRFRPFFADMGKSRRSKAQAYEQPCYSISHYSIVTKHQLTLYLSRRIFPLPPKKNRPINNSNLRATSSLKSTCSKRSALSLHLSILIYFMLGSEMLKNSALFSIFVSSFFFHFARTQHLSLQRFRRVPPRARERGHPYKKICFVRMYRSTLGRPASSLPRELC